MQRERIASAMPRARGCGAGGKTPCFSLFSQVGFQPTFSALGGADAFLAGHVEFFDTCRAKESERRDVSEPFARWFAHPWHALCISRDSVRMRLGSLRHPWNCKA
jgi:hypothetical protein